MQKIVYEGDRENFRKQLMYKKAFYYKKNGEKILIKDTNVDNLMKQSDKHGAIYGDPHSHATIQAHQADKYRRSPEGREKQKQEMLEQVILAEQEGYISEAKARFLTNKVNANRYSESQLLDKIAEFSVAQAQGDVKRAEREGMTTAQKIMMSTRGLVDKVRAAAPASKAAVESFKSQFQNPSETSGYGYASKEFSAHKELSESQKLAASATMLSGRSKEMSVYSAKLEGQLTDYNRGVSEFNKMIASQGDSLTKRAELLKLEYGKLTSEMARVKGDPNATTQDVMRVNKMWSSYEGKRKALEKEWGAYEKSHAEGSAFFSKTGAVLKKKSEKFGEKVFDLNAEVKDYNAGVKEFNLKQEEYFEPFKTDKPIAVRHSYARGDHPLDIVTMGSTSALKEAIKPRGENLVSSQVGLPEIGARPVKFDKKEAIRRELRHIDFYKPNQGFETVLKPDFSPGFKGEMGIKLKPVAQPVKRTGKEELRLAEALRWETVKGITPERVAISTGIGAGVGAGVGSLAGGVGAIPGAAIGGVSGFAGAITGELTEDYVYTKTDSPGLAMFAGAGVGIATGLGTSYGLSKFISTPVSTSSRVFTTAEKFKVDDEFTYFRVRPLGAGKVTFASGKQAGFAVKKGLYDVKIAKNWSESIFGKAGEYGDDFAQSERFLIAKNVETATRTKYPDLFNTSFDDVAHLKPSVAESYGAYRDNLFLQRSVMKPVAYAEIEGKGEVIKKGIAGYKGVIVPEGKRELAKMYGGIDDFDFWTTGFVKNEAQGVQTASQFYKAGGVAKIGKHTVSTETRVGTKVLEKISSKDTGTAGIKLFSGKHTSLNKTFGAETQALQKASSQVAKSAEIPGIAKTISKVSPQIAKAGQKAGSYAIAGSATSLGLTAGRETMELGNLSSVSPVSVPATVGRLKGVTTSIMPTVSIAKEQLSLKTKSLSKQSELLKVTPVTALSSQQLTKTSVSLSLIPKNVLKTGELGVSVPKTAVILREQLATGLKTGTIQLTKLKIGTPGLPGFMPPPPPIIPGGGIGRPPGKSKTGVFATTKPKKAFRVRVRENNAWRNLRGKFSREDAINKGARNVDFTRTDAFELKKTKAKKLSRSESYSPFNLKEKFYRKGGIFFEKKKYQNDLEGSTWQKGRKRGKKRKRGKGKARLTPSSFL